MPRDDITDLISEIMIPLVEIFFAHPEDLIEIDMSELPSYAWFLSDVHIRRGEMYKIQDKELKKSAIQLCIQHPDRCFKGTKEEKNERN